MKANELMIGDWVYYNGLNEEIPHGAAMVTCVAEGRLLCVNDKKTIYEFAQPIPLTAEILEKNFPRADKVAWWDAYDKNTFEIHIYGSAISIDGLMLYVHELQHALRLCGLNALANSFKV